MTRYLSTLLVAGVLVFAAAGNAVASATVTEESSPVELRFSWWGGDSRHEATLNAIDVFEQKNEGITIAAEYGGWDGYHPKLATQLAGGAAPDLIQVDVTWLADLVAQGDVFYDLSQLKDKIAMEGFDSNFLSDWSILNGRLQGLPTGINGMTAIINESLLRSAGISTSAPWTWERIVTEGRKLRQAVPDAYFLNQGPAQVGVFIFGPYINQITGGQVINPDFSVGFDRTAAVQVLTYINTLYRDGIAQPMEESTLYGSKLNENPLWVQGKMAMDPDFSSVVMLMVNSSPGQEIATARYPIMANAQQTGLVVRPAQLIAINERTEHLAESAMFVDAFFNDPDVVAALGLERSVPANAAARTILLEKGIMDKVVADAVQVAVENSGLPPNPLTTNQEILQILNDVIQKVAFGRSTPQQAADELIGNLEAKLAELKAAQ